MKVWQAFRQGMSAAGNTLKRFFAAGRRIIHSARFWILCILLINLVLVAY